MKSLLTFLTALLVCCAAHSQAVLNEIYAYPSVSGNEFFELYSTSTDSVPKSVDGYTLISYFKDGSKEGFYIMDLPNMTISPGGFFVGASAIPFNYQGIIGDTNANFSWNDPALPSKYGYVKKMVHQGSSYVEEPFTDTNDFFSHRNGSGASYNAFLYKDGQLINAFVGGTGGNTFVPDFILSMPTLTFTNVTAGGRSACSRWFMPVMLVRIKFQ